MESPADTLNYMIAGYTVIFGVMIVYIVSIVMRWIRLKREEKALEDLEG